MNGWKIDLKICLLDYKQLYLLGQLNSYKVEGKKHHQYRLENNRHCGDAKQFSDTEKQFHIFLLTELNIILLQNQTIALPIISPNKLKSLLHTATSMQMFIAVF